MAETSLQGKVALITGSNSGIGKVTARELARLGATVVMVSRNRAKGEAAQAEIKEATGNPNVDLLIADLSSLNDVRRLAKEFQEKYSQLHILINNAGGVNASRSVTADGIETTFATNYLAPFLLTQLLLDTLKASAPARIINVSSTAHTAGSIDFADLHGEKRYSTWKAYGQAKLALIQATYELSRQLEGTGVTVNALHPGVIASNFDTGLGPVMRWGWKMATPFFSTVDQGAQTTLYLATSPDVEGVNGKYFDNRKEKKSSPRSYDREVQKKLWQLSEELVRPKENG